MVQHPYTWDPRLNIAPLCDNLFLYFLCHPYTLITFVENFCSLLRWRVCWSSVAGCHKNPHTERYLVRCHLYKRIQRGTFVSVSFENQSGRLLSYLVAASEEYDEEEEEYEENEN